MLLRYLVPTVLCVSTVFGQSDPGRLTLDRIYNSGEFQGGPGASFSWFDATTGTQMEPSITRKGFHDLVRVNSADGTKTVLIPAEKLVPPGAKDPLRTSGYLFSKDQSFVLFTAAPMRVWRRDTRSDYWTYHIPTGTLAKLGGDAKPSSLMFAKFSPDGTRVAYVRDNNIWVEPSRGGAKPAQLTTDGTVGGSHDVINGTFDWVYEEELDCRDGFRWSPDGSRIAYWQLNTLGVPRFTMVNQTDGRYQKMTTFAYPKTGEQNSLCRVGVVPVVGGATTWMSIPGDTRTDGYIARMDFLPDGSELFIQRLNRLQNTNTVMYANIKTGQVQTIMTEKDAAYVDIHDEETEWLNEGAHFTWISDRDGWRHLYVVPKVGGSARQVTFGAFDVKEILKIDEKSGWVYFLASPGKPTEQYLYRTPLNPPAGKAEAPVRLTPAASVGWNDYRINPFANQAVWSHSAFGVPATTALVNVDEHKTIRPIQDNLKLKESVGRLARGPVEWFQVDVGDGFAMDGWLIKPPDFDPSKKYPLLIHVYGEPAGQTVVNRWGGNNYLWYLHLAQQGYLVASMDNRGTKSPKGRAWRKSLYRKIGQTNVSDQAKGARELAGRAYVDAGRIAVWGWSGGGTMTLNLMFQYPELYATGMSVAPVPDMSLYDTIYQERYMGLPVENAADYKAGSPITHAARLKGNLLLVHGTGDDNVHYQGTEKLMNVLVAENKPFTVMPYPNRSHSISEGKGTTRHLFMLMTRYLLEKMPPGAK